MPLVVFPRAGGVREFEVVVAAGVVVIVGASSWWPFRPFRPFMTGPRTPLDTTWAGGMVVEEDEEVPLLVLGL